MDDVETTQSASEQPSESREMTERSRKRVSGFAVFCALLMSAGLGAFVWKMAPVWFEDSSNYSIQYDAPAGWVQLSPGQLTLFRYKHPKHEVFLQGFQDQIVHERLTDPELDANGLANYYLDVTRENLKEWTGKRMSDYKGGTMLFSMIRREKPGKVVYLAFATKGNTTLGVSLYASGKHIPKAEALIDDYRAFLASVRLTPTTYP